ncbi:MAG: DHH family phosphoesterase [Paludibacteraceae bacterium]|nr:DHH family phosphoesterase [Paludibacteraceae bacterium]
MITTEQIEQVRALLPGKKHIVIFTHMAPDGDAMGSSLGLKLWLQSNSALGCPEVKVIIPSIYPNFLKWLPTAEECIVFASHPDEAKQAVKQADLVFCLDFNEPKRIAEAAELLPMASCPKVLVDHHLGPDHSMVDVVISYPEAPAACYLVLELLNGLASQNLSTDVATCLYCGLMTDTGNFAFNSNNPVLYEMIAELLRAGINKDQIFDAVFNQYSVDRMELMGYCLFRKMKIYKNFHTALITLTTPELKRFHFQKGDSEGLVNLPLQIADVHYSVFMREDTDRIKISFRSQGNRPVNIFAHEFFNGGGHMNAAGGESFSTMDSTVKLFEDHFRDFFSKE